MITVTLIHLLKSFFFLRIFKSLSFLVSMLKQVFYDLQAFLLFYFILMFMFGIIFSIIDWGNYEFNDDEYIRNIQYTATGPDKEYLLINKFFARMIVVLRISLGDFEFSSSTYLTPFQNVLYWLMFVLMVIVTCIVFLNFIIAEVSASYQSVKDILNVSILQERGQMINESEDMLRARFGTRIAEWKHLFPKYIITRELDD